MKKEVPFFTKSKSAFAISILIIGCSMLSSAPLFSQGSTGRILGTVTDQSGGAVAGAAVTVTDTARGTSRNLTTDDAGEYIAPSLTPSTYKVHVEAKGFKTIDRQNIVLEVNGNLRVDLQLQPGDVSQTITVTEEIPLVETTNAELGGTLQNTIIENLPLNGRNFENLLTLRPGVEIYVGGGGWTQSTNGIRPHDNTYLVEGVNGNDPWMAQSIMNAAMAAGDAGTILPVDSIQEFKTEVNPAAEYGWKPGAVVSVGIKSGTNSIHGTAYAYGRSDAFDARNYFNPDVHTSSGCTSDPVPCTKTPLSLEQFGATVGGPIQKDKLFFFTTFESQRYDVGNPTEHSVDSVGDFMTQCLSVPSNLRAPLSLQLAGLDANCNSVSGQPNGNFSGLFPVSSTGSLLTSLNSSNRIYSGLAKVDYHLNEKNVVSGFYFISPGSGTFVDNPGREVSPQWLTEQYARSQVGSGSWTWTPNSNWVNQARVGYSHYYQVFESVDHNQNPANYTFNGSTYNIFTGQADPQYFGLPRIRIGGPQFLGGSGGFQLGLQWPKTVGPDGVLQFADQVSYLRGKHAFKFGGEILRNTSTNNVTANAKGPAQFHGLPDFFQGIGQNSTNTGFLIGNLARQMSDQGYAVFFQDDWRLTPRLTVNLGMRYEIDTVFKVANNLVGNFDPTTPTGLVQVGNGISSPFNGDHNNFSPRVGFAWDVFGNGKTVIRGGGSIIYEQISLDAYNGLSNFLGLRMIPTGAQLFSSGDGTTFTQGTGTINVVATPGLSAPQAQANWFANSSSTPIYSQTPQCGTGIGGDPSPCDILGVNKNIRTPYVSTWTLGIQRQLTKDMSLEVAYVGNHGTKLLGVRNLNQPAVGSGFGPGALTTCAADATMCGAVPELERLNQPYTMSCPTTNGVGLGIGTNPCFPYLRFIEGISNLDKSNYNGMQVTLTQRASHGISFTAGYTYSHALDNNGDNEGNGLHTPQVSSDPGALYANSDFDIRHRFTFSVNYAIPGKKGYAQMLEGWSINSIVTLESGSVWGVNDQTSDFTGTGEAADPVGSIGEPWFFFGNKSDFTPVHGWSDTNGGWQNGGGGVPFFGPGDPFFTGTDPCSTRAAAIGPLAIASLTNTGCYAVGNSVLIPGAYGSSGPTLRNIFRDQGFRNWDMSVAKAFRFNERISAEFKAEFFNVLNHPWFANPYGGPGGQNVDPTGQPFGFVGLTPDTQASNPVLGSGGARAMQLGLKLTF